MPFANYAQTNLAQGLLSAGITAGQTTIVLQSGQGGLFPTTFPFKIIIQEFDAQSRPTKSEIATCTNRVSDTLTVTRASEAVPASYSALTQTSTPQSFATGAAVTGILTAAQQKDVQDELARLETSKLNVSDYQNGTKVYSATSTGTDSYAITLSPAPSSYQVGMCFRFMADVGNTGAATMNVNGLGAKTIKKLHDLDLATGDIEIGQIVTISYDGTNFQMDSQVATIPTVDVNGLTEKTSLDFANDAILIYSNADAANRKLKWSSVRATGAEVVTATENQKFVTPLALASRMNRFVDSGTTTGAGTITITHGLGRVPKFVRVHAMCGNAARLAVSDGEYDGTKYDMVFLMYSSTFSAANATNRIAYIETTSGSTAQSLWTVTTFDATSIVLTKAITWSDPGTIAYQVTVE